MTGTPLRILAIEPDPVSREELQRLLHERFPHVRIEVAAPQSADAALVGHPPDVMLVSALIPPRLEAQIVSDLRALDQNGHVPILTIPPVKPFAAARRGIAAWFNRPQRPPYDSEALLSRIAEALVSRPPDDETCDVRRQPGEGAAERIPDEIPVTRALVPIARPPAPAAPRSRKPRARRLTPRELPAPCTVATDRGLAVRIINISATGVLFESALKFDSDCDTSLQLLHAGSRLVLPSRFIRSEVAAVDRLGVKYRTAAAFGREVELFASVAPAGAPQPATLQALANLLVRVTTACAERPGPAAARAAFEAGLGRMLPGCAVQVRDGVAQPDDGSDSIYFSVPSRRGAILQTTFRAGYEPSTEEFMLLRWAAVAASVIVEYEDAAALSASVPEAPEAFVCNQWC